MYSLLPVKAIFIITYALHILTINGGDTASPTPSPIQPVYASCADRRYELVVLMDASCPISYAQCKKQQEFVAETVSAIRGTDLITVNSMIYSAIRVTYTEFDAKDANITIGGYHDPINYNVSDGDQSRMDLYYAIKDSAICDTDLAARTGSPDLVHAIRATLDEDLDNFPVNVLRDRKGLIVSNCAVDSTQQLSVCEKFETFIRTGLFRGSSDALYGINVVMLNNVYIEDRLPEPDNYIMCLVEYDENRIFVTDNSTDYIRDVLPNVADEICETPTPSPTPDPFENAPTFEPTTTSPTRSGNANPTVAPHGANVPNCPDPNNPLCKTDEPTTSPTYGPSADPTLAPTRNPTHQPTTSPSDNPTAQPTDTPSNGPTENPTNIPTDDPTEMPSNIPTYLPTEMPTGIPTYLPSEMPSNIPTHNPIDIVTDSPSESLLDFNVTGGGLIEISSTLGREEGPPKKDKCPLCWLWLLIAILFCCCGCFIFLMLRRKNDEEQQYERGNAAEPSISAESESDVVAATDDELQQLSIIS